MAAILSPSGGQPSPTPGLRLPVAEPHAGVSSRWVLGAHAFESVAANDHPNRVMPSHLGLLEDNPYAQGNRPYRLGSYMPGR